MRFDKLTLKAQEIFQGAQQAAEEFHHSTLDVEHLLFATLTQEGSIARPIIEKLDADPDALKWQVEEQLESMAKVEGAEAYGASLSPRLTRILQDAFKQAQKLGDEFVSTEHLLLAMAGDSGTAGAILKAAGLNEKNLLAVIEELRKGRRANDANAEEHYQALEKYGIDLTARARRGELDPVIGRDEEIRRVIQVLSRRTKNNPVLIGEPGVGKTAIAEGLARRIVDGDVPDGLRNKTVMALDLGAMVAGAKFRGEFEERLKSVLDEIKASSGDIIVFIDELHTLVGAGAAEGSLDAANMLKPMLARGELRCVGATTLDEYRKYIEKDKALERRFQMVLVDEPSVEETVSILRGLKERYEVHHGVRITDSALVAAATLSDRYITGRFLPDKAIDLIDESASRLKIEIDSVPAEIDEVERQRVQYEIDREALRKEPDAASKERLESTERKLAELNERASGMRAVWQREKEKIEAVRNLKAQIEGLRNGLQTAERESDWARAAEIQHGQIPELERQLVTQSEELDSIQSHGKMLKEEVDSEDVADVVSKWTGIPVSRLMEGEMQKLLTMEELLRKRVVGQDLALQAIADAVRRSRSGLSDPHRPIGSFLFLGPTGVGKTETAKALAEFLFDDERAMVRIDMSEYAERHSVARLIGAPPGYVGFEAGGQLTEAVRRRPYSVILLDEVEKAHPEVFNILLQLLDDGRLTDGQGRTVDFRNTVVILTSNLGSIHYADPLSGDGDWDETKRRVMEDVRLFFRPEFLNRLDDVIVFRMLGVNEIKRVVAIQLEDLASRLAERRITLKLSDEAALQVATTGFDPVYGARPLKRVIQREIMNPLASAILRGDVREGQTVVVDYREGGFVMTPEPVGA
jgi:ATP-dependent Clp protease ATP-binding subunit ClpB